MGYLDNSSITVDAVLTKKGREILKSGGDLNITSFTLSDTGVDYTLFNSDHPSGSAFFGEAIENLPMLEASVHSEYNLRNRLITLNQKATAIPSLVLSGLDSKARTTLTFDEGNTLGRLTVDLIGYTSVGNPTFGEYDYYFVIQDPNIVKSSSPNTVLLSNLSGTASGLMDSFLQESDIPEARMFGFNGTSFTLDPIQQDVAGRQTNIYVVHVETGAYNSFKVVNNITQDLRNNVPEAARQG
jgi:hypothetical protein